MNDLYRKYKLKREHWFFLNDISKGSETIKRAILHILKDIDLNQYHQKNIPNKQPFLFTKQPYLKAIELLVLKNIIEIQKDLYVYSKAYSFFKSTGKNKAPRVRISPFPKPLLIHRRKTREGKNIDKEIEADEITVKLQNWINQNEIYLDGERIYPQFKRIINGQNRNQVGRTHCHVLQGISSETRLDRVRMNTSQKMVEVDISQCHLKILCLFEDFNLKTDIYNEVYPEDRDFAKDIVYTYGYGRSLQNAQRSIINLFYKDLRMHPNESKAVVIGILETLERFPIRSLSSVYVQFIESEIMSLIFSELIDFKIPFWPIYDSIVTHPEYEDFVLKLFSKYLTREHVLNIISKHKIPRRKFIESKVAS